MRFEVLDVCFPCYFQGHSGPVGVGWTLEDAIDDLGEMIAQWYEEDIPEEFWIEFDRAKENILRDSGNPSVEDLLDIEINEEEQETPMIYVACEVTSELSPIDYLRECKTEETQM